MNGTAITQYKAVIEAFPRGAYTPPSAYRVASLFYNEEHYKEAGRTAEAAQSLQALIIEPSIDDEWKKGANYSGSVVQMTPAAHCRSCNLRGHPKSKNFILITVFLCS